MHAYFRDALGAVTDMGSLGGRGTAIRGLNGRGQAVGWSSTAAERSEAVIWSTATGFVQRATGRGQGSDAYRINDAGQAAGVILSSNREDHYFVCGALSEAARVR